MKIEKAIKEDVKEKTSDKHFYVIVGIIVLFFIAFIAFQQTLDEPQPATIQDLHIMNLEGELDEEQGYVYSGLSFIFLDGLWYTRISLNDELFDVPLHYGPRDVEDVPETGELGAAFNVGEDVLIVVDPLSSNSEYTALAASELAQNMATAIKRRPVGACDKNETDMCADRPIVTCETSTAPLIYLVQEEGPSVEYDGNCITLRGQLFDLTKAVDRLLLRWYGIIA
jgi:hypothetical protein